MADIFDQLATQAPAQTAKPPAAGGDIFDHLAAGQSMSAQPTQFEQAHQPQGFTSTLGSDLVGMVKGIPETAVDLGTQGLYSTLKKAIADYESAKATGSTVTQQEDQQRQQAGHGLAYRVMAPAAAQATGTNLVGMEQSAERGDTAGVLGHAAAPVAAMAAGTGLAKAGGAVAGYGRGAAASAISDVAPKTVSVAGEDIPKLASQEPYAPPRAAEGATLSSEPEIAQGQQQAGQQAVKNIAGQTATANVQKVVPGVKNVKNIGTFGDAADALESTAKPTFKKLDQLSDGMFNTYQNKSAAAQKIIRRATDMESLESAEAAKAEADNAIGDLIDHHKDQFAPGEYAKARAAWRDKIVLEKVDGFIERAFKGATDEISQRTGVAQRHLSGESLTGNLNKLRGAIPEADLERVLGRDAVDNLYRVADALSDAQKMKQANTAVAFVTKEVSKLARYSGGPAARAVVLHSIATNGRIGQMLINIVNTGASPKIYAPLMGMAVAQSSSLGNRTQAESQGQ